jgi:hypothetical protein
MVSTWTPAGAVTAMTTARAIASGSSTPAWRDKPNRGQYVIRS